MAKQEKPLFQYTPEFKYAPKVVTEVEDEAPKKEAEAPKPAAKKSTKKEDK